MSQAVLETPSERYVLEEYLAEGGMGAIYLGRRDRLGGSGPGEAVVLKQLLPEYTQEPQFIDLFLREARITAALDHPNIVHTIDLVSAGSDYFIVMEYVRGADLRTLIKRARRAGHRLAPEAGLHIGAAICDALAYAHSRVQEDGSPLGLIHRDISPSNILCSGDGEVKLTDFGIAKAATHRSVFYRVKGKVGYMSPEQARGETLDARSDLFSLAVCVWEVLAGERLFVGDLRSTPSMIYSQPVPRLSEKRRDLPGALDPLMLRALSLDRAARFPDAAAFGAALRELALAERLLWSARELSGHLADVCGPEAEHWHREGDQVTHGGRPATEIYAASEVRSEPGGEDRSAPRGGRLGEGTELTSILNLGPRSQLRAAGIFDAEPTQHYDRARRRGRMSSLPSDDDDPAEALDPDDDRLDEQVLDEAPVAAPPSPGGTIGRAPLALAGPLPGGSLPRAPADRDRRTPTPAEPTPLPALAATWGAPPATLPDAPTGHAHAPLAAQTTLPLDHAPTPTRAQPRRSVSREPDPGEPLEETTRGDGSSAPGIEEPTRTFVATSAARRGSADPGAATSAAHPPVAKAAARSVSRSPPSVDPPGAAPATVAAPGAAIERALAGEPARLLPLSSRATAVLVVLLVLAAGVALGVLWSDPGAEADAPASAGPSR